jgi:hypothetical protein
MARNGVGLPTRYFGAFSEAGNGQRTTRLSFRLSLSLGNVTSRIEQRSCVGERKRLDLSDYSDGHNDMSITSVACLYSELK